MKQLIERRIGREIFIEKLSFITKHEYYSKAAQKPQPAFSSPDHMMFDHEFTKLVKELEGKTLLMINVFSLLDIFTLYCIYCTAII